MSGVDWSQAPDGRQPWVSPSGTFCLERISGKEICLIGKGHRVAFEWGDQAYALFGELLSSANSPSAAEDDLRRITYDYCIESDWIEDDESDKRLPIERRLQAMVDQLNAQAVNNDCLRAEVSRLKDTDLQVRRCEALLDIRNKMQEKNDALKAERDQLRAELERVRQEIDNLFQANHNTSIENGKLRLRLLDEELAKGQQP